MADSYFVWRATGKVCTAGGADGQSSLVSKTAGARKEVGDMLNEVSALTEENEKLKRENNALKQQMKQMQGTVKAERRRVSNEMQKLEKEAENNKRKEKYLRDMKEELDASWQSFQEQRKQQQSNPLAVATGSQGLAQASTVAIVIK